MKLNWLTKIFITIFPKAFFQCFAVSRGISPAKLDRILQLFSSSQRIDFQPLSGENRGLIIFLDNKLSLWFCQDGDHFIFDGFELGEYDNGLVTVFDNLNKFND